MKAANLTETMSAKDIQAVENALKSLRQKMPYLVTLTHQERTLLREPGHQRLALMGRTLEAASDHASLLPQQFDLEQFQEQVSIVQALDRCLTSVRALASDIRDTLCVLASDPLKATAEIRAYVVAASVRTPALEELAQRLSKSRARPAKGQPAANGASSGASPPAPAAPGTSGPATPGPGPAAPTPPQDKAA